MARDRPFVALWRDAVLSPNGLSTIETAVGCALAKHADKNGGSCWPSQKTIAAEIGCSDRAVRNAIPALEKGGWIHVKVEVHTGGIRGQVWRSNYRLTIPHEVERGSTSSPEEAERDSCSSPLEAELDSGSLEKRRNEVPEEAERGSYEPDSEPENTYTCDSGNRYSAEFEVAWIAYPKRTGGNSKLLAYEAWTDRLRAGADASELTQGVKRYAAYCEAQRNVGTRYVKQASNFFGPGEHWREEWVSDNDETPCRLDPRILENVRRV